MSRQEDVYVVLVYMGEIPDEFTDAEGVIIPERRRDAVEALSRPRTQSSGTGPGSYISTSWALVAVFSDRVYALSVASNICQQDPSVLVVALQLRDNPLEGIYSCVEVGCSFIPIPEAGALSDNQ